MLQINTTRNSIKRANNFMDVVRRCSLYDLPLALKKDAIKKYYPSVSGGPNRTKVDKLEERQATAILFDFYENAQKVLRGPRQATYLTLRELEQAAREKNQDKFEDLEERLCIQLAQPDTYDYEVEQEYFAFQKIKKDIIPFSSSQSK